MAFNGSGTFNRLYKWVNDKANGIKINATRMDAEMDGMAVGLSTCITRNGQTTITADLPMNGKKHLNVDDAEAANQYLTYGQSLLLEWLNFLYVTEYVSATSFKVSGVNVTTTYSVARRVKAVGSLTGTIYGTISASAYVSDTTVTVVWDSGSLTNESITVYPAFLKGGSTGLSFVVQSAALVDLSVTTAKINTLAVTTAKIAANAVTYDKLATDVGVPVGVVLEYEGLNLPDNFFWANGDLVARSNALLFSAITASITGTIANGNATITSVNTDLTSKGVIGAVLEGVGITAGTIIQRITATTITMSAPATADTAALAILVFPHGAGDGSTTLNLPNRSGRISIGREGMGGVAASNVSQVSSTITTVNTNPAVVVASAAGLCAGMKVISANIPYGATILSISGTTLNLSANATAGAAGTVARFSLITDAQSLAGTGGSPVNTLGIPQIPAHAHDLTLADVALNGSGRPVPAAFSISNLSTSSVGGGQPHANLPPVHVPNYIIRYR